MGFPYGFPPPYGGGFAPPPASAFGGFEPSSFGDTAFNPMAEYPGFGMGLAQDITRQVPYQPIPTGQGAGGDFSRALAELRTSLSWAREDRDRQVAEYRRLLPMRIEDLRSSAAARGAYESKGRFQDEGEAVYQTRVGIEEAQREYERAAVEAAFQEAQIRQQAQEAMQREAEREAEEAAAGGGASGKLGSSKGKSLTIARLGQAWRAGLISEDEYRAELGALGYDPTEADLIIGTTPEAKTSAAAKGKEASVDTLNSGVKNGTVNFTAFRAAMSAKGYADDDIVMRWRQNVGLGGQNVSVSRANLIRKPEAIRSGEREIRAAYDAYAADRPDPKSYASYRRDWLKKNQSAYAEYYGLARSYDFQARKQGETPNTRDFVSFVRRDLGRQGLDTKGANAALQATAHIASLAYKDRFGRVFKNSATQKKWEAYKKTGGKMSPNQWYDRTKAKTPTKPAAKPGAKPAFKSAANQKAWEAFKRRNPKSKLTAKQWWERAGRRESVARRTTTRAS